MNVQHTQTWQPVRAAWSNKHLLCERALALGHSIELSTAITYTSHLQSYLTFCKLHDHPICPTVDTLSFFVVFMCHHINPKSISTYLSGICNTLELQFPKHLYYPPQPSSCTNLVRHEETLWGPNTRSLSPDDRRGFPLTIGTV